MLNLCHFNSKELNFKYLLDTSVILVLIEVLKELLLLS